MNLTQDLLAGNRRALARALTLVESQHADASALLAALYPNTGHAHLIGLTGPPGSGKSTLVNALARQLRATGETVAIIAVDPTSPFTGGAILGDRIRMRDLAGDEGVFIRSMATRGSLGGLAYTTADVMDVLDAAGFDRVLIETVGAGQSEVDIAATAQTTLVVEAPGLGDDVQALKAGILEIADILVLNKADHPAADAAYRTLRAMLSLASSAAPGVDKGDSAHHGAHSHAPSAATAQAEAGEAAASDWKVALLKTIATEANGVAELLTAIDCHRDYLRESGALLQRREARIRANLRTQLRDELLERYLQGVNVGRFEAAVAAVVARELDPHSAVESLLEE